MSGLEPLAALGLACNVFQALSFAGEVCMVARRIFAGLTPDDSEAALAAPLGKLATIYTDIETQTRSASQRLTAGDKKLVDIAKDCNKAALDLKVAIEKSTPAAAAKGSFRQSVRMALKAVSGSNKTKVENLEKLLQAHRTTLETHLLANLCSKTDAIKALQQSGSNKIDSTLRSFIQKYAEGETRMATLLTRESDSIKQHVSNETAALERSVTRAAAESRDAHDGVCTAVTRLEAGIAHAASSAGNEASRERLLRSLKFPTMNQRRNDIADPHSKTFEWIFTGRGKSSEYESGDDESSVGDEEDGDGEDDDSSMASDDSSMASDDSSMANDDRAGRATRGDIAACFEHWLRTPDDSLFWISGKPGSGKSTLLKFLSEDQRTLRALRSSAPNMTILSHFFWISGHPMESRIKGLFCNLLYQLVDRDKASGEAILQRFPRVVSKDSHSDWSNKELNEALLFGLHRSSRAYCLFIDGLDEIHPSEGQSNLLDPLDTLRRKAPTLMMCVSSRPEPILQNRLSGMPGFRIQDLTHSDIWSFAFDVLRRAIHRSHLSFDSMRCWRLASELCTMAEGVFLWVALAVRSILTGLGKRDGWDELDRRLEVVPGDMMDLYRSMWDRLGTEKEVYQSQSSAYLNLILAQATQARDFDGYDLTPLNITLAIDSQLADRVRRSIPKPPFSRDELRQLCEGMADRLEVHCLGLISLHNRVLPKGYRSVRLIHRSAKEFLETDKEAATLLGYDDSTHGERLCNIEKAFLLSAYLFATVDTLVPSFLAHRGLDIPASRIGHLYLDTDIPRQQITDLGFLALSLFDPDEFGQSIIPSRGHTQTLIYWKFYDFLGSAAQHGCFDLLQGALEGKAGGLRRTGAPSIAYLSYLLSTALRPAHSPERPCQKARFENIQFEVVQLLMSYGIHPNLPTAQSFLGGKEPVIFPITPMEAVVSYVLEENLATENALWILRALIGCGGDLSRPIILSTCVTIHHGRHVVYSSLGPLQGLPGLYIEVNLAFAIELALWKITREGVHYPRLRELADELLPLSIPPLATRAMFKTGRHVIDENYRPYMTLQKWYYNFPNDHCYVVSDPKFLSRLMGRLKESYEQDPIPAEDEDSCDEEIMGPLFKEMQEVGELTAWEEIEKDWLARELVWRKDDKRCSVPDW